MRSNTGLLGVSLVATTSMPTSILLPLSSRSSRTFAQHGLYDYLQADTRPTFLVALSASNDPSKRLDTSRVLYNTSLSTNNVLLGEISRALAELSSKDDPGHDETVDFLSWIWGEGQSSIWFCDTLWSSTDINLSWRIISGVHLPRVDLSSKLINRDHLQHPLSTHLAHGRSIQSPSEDGNAGQLGPRDEKCHLSEILLSSVAEPSAHQQHVQSFDWANTELGPIATWPQTLYQAVKHALACPMATFIFWGPSRNMIWNDAGIDSLRGFEAATPGVSAFQLFKTLWYDYHEPLYREVERTGRALAPKQSPGPLIERDGGLRETFWTYNYVPLLDDNGGVCGLHASIYDCTTEVIMEARTNTLLKVNEAMGVATDLSSFWQTILAELRENAADAPLAAIYSVGSEAMIDHFSNSGTQQPWQASSSVSFQDRMHSVGKWILEGKIGFPHEHVCVPPEMAFCAADSLATAFRQAMVGPEIGDVLLCTESGSVPSDFLVGCEDRGLGFECTQLLACPLQRPSGGVIAWLVLGINPRRTFDDEYKRFIRLLSRHIESKLALILTLEREKRTALQKMNEAAQQQQRLSVQIQQQRQELEQSHSRFFKFAKQAPFGVYILGRNGEIEFCNDTWCRMLDIVPETAAPKAWLARAHPDDIEGLERQWDRLSKGFIHDRFEWRVLRPGSTSFDSDDDMIYLESCGFPEMAEDGTMNSVTGLLTDVSIHKAYQREQAGQLENALKAKRAQEQFMDMVSHEMRNPLNAIIQCAGETSELIERLRDSTSAVHEISTVLNDITDMISTVLYCGAHQKQLIDDVLTLSKLDANLLVVYPVKVYPAALLSQAMKVFSTEIRASKVNVFTSLDKSLNINTDASAVMADPSRIIQILINLISNAIKFMKGREKRELHVTVHTARERRSTEALRYFSSGYNRADPTSAVEWGTGEPVYMYFSVRDTGPGLSDSELGSLFARFQQASPRTHVTYGGSGLGLFISRELTELHGGEIGMTSEVGQGTTFVFCVKGRRPTSPSENSGLGSSPRPPPYHETMVSGPGADRPATAPSPVSNSLPQPELLPTMHVLVVEDNDVNRKVLKRQLETRGHRVTTAVHGEQALAILRTSSWWQGDSMEEGTQLSDCRDIKPRFSVILCDLEMPVMDGITCVRQIRQWQQDGLLYDDIPVVAVTGNARAEANFLVADSDFDHVVSKPYSFKHLVEQMSALVN